MERWPVTPAAPPGTDGQRRGGAGSGGAGVQANAGRLAPSPPPVACRLPRGCAQRRPGLPGSPQRCDGVSAARAPGEGPSALIRQGRALAPDSCLPEPGPRGQAPGQGVLWGTEPALGEGGAEAQPRRGQAQPRRAQAQPRRGQSPVLGGLEHGAEWLSPVRGQWNEIPFLASSASSAVSSAPNRRLNGSAPPNPCPSH